LEPSTVKRPVVDRPVRSRAFSAERERGFARVADRVFEPPTNVWRRRRASSKEF
jgi:hypothetical protein